VDQPADAVLETPVQFEKVSHADSLPHGPRA
jgi:hypothetical protein